MSEVEPLEPLEPPGSADAEAEESAHMTDDHWRRAGVERDDSEHSDSNVASGSVATEG